MLQLFIDTSTEKAFVGIAHRHEIVECHLLQAGMQNSKYLFPALLELLNKNKFSPKDLELIGCGAGPGSYTGIRVGAATAQSMAYALRLPLVGISSLEAYVPLRNGPFATVLDARYGGVYFQKGWKGEKEVVFYPEPQVASLTQVAEALSDVATIVTPHLSVLKERIGSFFPHVNWEEGNPSPETFAGRIHEQYIQGNFSTKAELKLLYLRKTQAETEMLA